MSSDISFPPSKPGDSIWYSQAMEKLIDVIQELSIARDLESIMRIVRTSARALTGADGVTFVLRDDDQCYYADEDAITPLWKGQRFPISACVSGWAMIHGQHVVIKDIYKDARIPADAYRPTFVKSLAMVPIRQNSPVGAIGNYWATQREPTADEVKILQALANATSIAMENVGLYTRLQQELQQVERTILDNIVDGIITINNDFAIVRYNKACEHIFGYKKDEVLGNDIRQFVPPAHLPLFEQAMKSYKEGNTTAAPAPISGIELQGRRKNGESFPAELSFNEVYIGDNRYYSAIIRDISERKLVQRKLKESEERYELAVRGTNDGLWDWDVTGNQLYWSDRFKNMLGITDLSFHPTYDEFKNRLHPDDYENVVVKLERHTREGTSYDEAFRMRKEDGDYIWLRARGAGIWNSEGMATRMCGSVSDITAQKMAEGEIEDARAEALRANRAKSEFLAHMSHELRTPLNSILGLTRIMCEDRAMDAEQLEMAALSHKSACDLLEIVNDILDLSKVESGNLELENLIFSYEEVAHNAIETLLPQCSEKGLILVPELKFSGMPYFIGDPFRIGRILINLIGNAIKYTDKGSITFQAGWTSDGGSDDRGILHATITDTGIGIPEDRLDMIFDRFTQADNSITRRFGGTGLGLTITREIIHKMGGHIEVKSTLGKGSSFRFSIPLPITTERPEIARESFKRTPHERLPADQLIDLSDLRLLIAEDHLLNQVYLEKLLPRIGITHFDIADNGQALIEKLSAGHYNMILVDCHMPILSGYDATRIIRDNEAPAGGRIPIIAMTADAMLGTRERCIASGMDDYVSKPIHLDEFRHILSRWINFPESEDTGETTEAARPAPVASLKNLADFAATKDEYRKYLDTFISQAHGDLAVLEQNCTDGENETWSRAAHRLKGGCGMVDAQKMMQALIAAQDMNVATADERRKILKKIRALYNEAVIQLHKDLESF